MWGVSNFMESFDTYRRCLREFEKQTTPKEYGMYLASKKRRKSKKSKGKKKRR